MKKASHKIKELHALHCEGSKGCCSHSFSLTICSWGSKVFQSQDELVDNRTHNILEGLSLKETDDYITLAKVGFLEPIHQWMKPPQKDMGFGSRL